MPMTLYHPSIQLILIKIFVEPGIKTDLRTFNMNE